jgi:hypothetical protein
MTRFNPENKKSLLLNEILDSLSKVETKKEADLYFADYVAFIQKDTDIKQEAAVRYAKEDIGYYSGYFDKKVFERINELFNTKHPVFGKKYPTLDEALSKKVN